MSSTSTLDIAATLASLSLDQKLSLLAGADLWQTVAYPERGVPALFLADGPHGLRKAAGGESVGLSDALPATCFPTASGLAASWDPALLERVGHAIGVEARAAGVDVVLGPGMNIKRHPLGGRNFEYLSEDPLLSGRLAGAMVRGIQGAGVGACLKHFAVNNHERERMVVDALVDECSLREIYLRGFEIAVRESDPACVMAAYNRVNGTFACEHPWLLTELLRQEWGFSGLVMSDWGAVDDRVAGVAAGLDLEMPGSHGHQEPLLRAALADGRLSVEQIDACVGRLLALQARVQRDAPAKPVDLDAHHALARQAAARCAVLLKNEGDLLPLGGEGSIAVIGALAMEPRYQGAGSSGVNPTRLDSAWDALLDAVGEERLRYAAGYTLDDRVHPQLVEEALAVAAEAELLLVFAGLPPSYESEAFDREHMRLPQAQDLLIDALAATGKPVVLVLANGAPVAMPWIDDVGAVLEGYLGGQAGGSGIVDVITGAVNPSGKLAESFVHRPEDHASHPWFPGDGVQVQHREGLYVGYRWLDTVGLEPLFPFGHGLSYTAFTYRALEIEQDWQKLRVKVEIENTGGRAGAEVVQVYAHALNPGPHRPAQVLSGFGRIELAPGQRGVVAVELDPEALAVWRGGWVLPGGAYELRVGASSRDIRLRAQVEIPGEALSPDSAVPRAYRRPTAPLSVCDQDFEALLGRPLPARRPPRPFHRNSTVGQLRATALGRLLHRVALWRTKAILGVGDDPLLNRLAERALVEIPLRSMVNQAGALSWRGLSALLALLNGRPLRALLRLLRQSPARIAE
jgi:beta-glucosidase